MPVPAEGAAFVRLRVDYPCATLASMEDLMLRLWVAFVTLAILLLPLVEVLARPTEGQP
jgi:hypothetical protein